MEWTRPQLNTSGLHCARADGNMNSFGEDEACSIATFAPWLLFRWDLPC